MPETMEISEAAKSGNGTLEKVGIKVDGKSKSPVNNQLFDTQEALDLHLKYLHDPKKWNPNLQHCDFHNHVGDSYTTIQRITRRLESSKTSSNRPKSSLFRLHQVLLNVHQRLLRDAESKE